MSYTYLQDLLAIKLIADNGKQCKSCGVIFDAAIPLRRRNLDHCHKTGKVRGFICHRCNNIAGLANDNVGILKSVIAYLEASICTTSLVNHA